MIQILLQILATFILFGGWAFLVYPWLVRRTGSAEQAACWSMMAGFTLPVLLAQQCYYFGVPLWAATSLVGLISMGGLISRGRDWVPLVTATRIRCSWRLCAIVTAFAGATIVTSSASLLVKGPNHYFGRASFDQVNYVISAQYIIEDYRLSPEESTGLRPWLEKGQEIAQHRLSQSVAHAMVSIASAQDAQQTYGTLVLMFLLLFAVASYGLARSLGASIVAAACGGFLVTLLPCIGMVQLGGFLSHTASLWTFPALASIFAAGLPRLVIRALCAVTLAWLLGAYTEFFPVGFGFLLACLLILQNPRKGMVDAGWVIAGTLALNLGYLAKATTFFSGQVKTALIPNILLGFFPPATSLKGLSALLLGPTGGAAGYLAGAACLGLVAALPWVFSGHRRVVPGIVIAGTVTLLAGLACMSHFPTYAFTKVVVSTVPVLVCGMVAAACVAVRPLFRYCYAAFLLVVFIGSASFHFDAQSEILAGTPATARADTRARAEELAQFEGITPTILSEEDPFGLCWLVYYLRNNDVFVQYETIGDRCYASEIYSFRQVPGGLRDWLVVDSFRVRPNGEYIEIPRLDNPNANPRSSTSTNDVLITGSMRGHAKSRYWLSLSVRPTSDLAAGEFEALVGSQIYRLTTPGFVAIPLPSGNSVPDIQVRSRVGVPFKVVVGGYEPVRNSGVPPHYAVAAGQISRRDGN